MKKKLSFDEQIKDLEDKGVSFEIVGKEDAKKFLQYNNYYFKLKSYANNYPINPKTNKYVNLDFAYLIELSKLDMYIRKFVIDMALDIEHFLKTKMLYDLCKNNEEDGYNIVKKFLFGHKNVKETIDKTAESYSICSELALKHLEEHDYALWNIVEVISFGNFVDLYNTYYQEYDSYNFGVYLGSIKFLRNAAAHNNCLLSFLLKPHGVKKFKKTKQLCNALARVKDLSESSRNKKMENPIIHDFIALLFVYNDLLKTSTTKQMRDMKMKELQKFFCDPAGRVLKNKHYFEKNGTITETYKFVANVINYIVNQNNNPKHVNFL